ncbi:MAG: diaminopimelate decarboxylase [Gemmatimonadetes bacterium]|nr:MAG: diaminopimelate decarboxylase [Gemmatimonadota bacterium]
MDGTLAAGEVPLDALAREFGTPLYVYDWAVARTNLERLRAAFGDADLLVAYSVKANGNLALLARLAGEGAGADIVSGGELHRCLLAGVPPERIVFAGVGKTRDEIAAALDARILAFNVESRGELEVIDALARERGVRARFAVRVNPDIEAGTPHEYTRTGHAATKFGVAADEALALYRWAAGRPALEAVGIDVHIGSQIVEPEPYRRALAHVLEIADRLASEGVSLRFVDLGGGYGVRYADEEAMAIETLARLVVPPVRERGLRLVLEPGRFIVGDAGVLVARVLYVKRSGTKTFVITDGGMTELIRPSHYRGYHEIEPVRERPGAPRVTADVVGPICETGDFLARERTLPLPEPGDLLAVRTAGAYGFTMASNYNGRRRPAEVLVDGDDVVLARRRESFDDLVRGERLPDGGYAP